MPHLSYRGGTLIRTSLSMCLRHGRFRASADLARNRPRYLRCGIADQYHYHCCANGEPQELH